MPVGDQIKAMTQRQREANKRIAAEARKIVEGSERDGSRPGPEPRAGG